MVNSLSQSVFLNSYFLDSKFKRCIEQNKRSVVYQSVEFTSTIPSNKAKENSLRLILSGRFAPGKGQLDAIKALNILKQNNENITLTLIGSGEDSYSSQVREYIKKNSLEEHVELVNFAKNTSPYYSRANVALVCSRCEAFGRITIEAMKMGVVVIASDTGANTELIRDNFNGILYQYGNIEDLAKKIILTKDSKLRERLSEQANKWANDTFNLEKYSYKLDSEIKRVLELPL
ncbi:putative poly(glycerol-phosphate) alpha-glucosyltransferase [compost metagenome]